MSSSPSFTPVEPPGSPAGSPGSPIAPLVAPRPARSRSGTILLVAALVVAAAGVAFAVGRLTAPTASASGFGGNGLPQGSFVPRASGDLGGRGGFAGVGGGLTVEGTVSAVADGSITVQTASGTSVTIATTSSTTYHSQAAATASQVTTGTKVIVRTDASGGPGGAFPSPGAAASPGNRTLTASDVTVAAQ